MTKDEAFDVLEKSKPKISEGSLKHITYDKAITVLKEELAQRQWVGLTDEEWETTHWSPDFRAGAKWAESKLKEKTDYELDRHNG